MPNCAKRWSIRPQRPRCSALSADRPQMCSRCRCIVESAAKVCGVDDVLLRLREGDEWYARSFWSHTHCPCKDQQ